MFITIVAPKISSKTPRVPCPSRIKPTPAGTQMSGVPSTGRNAVMIMMAPQNSALGTPKISSPRPPSPPWITAVST